MHSVQYVNTYIYVPACMAYYVQSNLLMYNYIIMYSHLLQSCGGPSVSGKAKPGVHYRLNARDIPFILGTVRKLLIRVNIRMYTYIDKYTRT